MADAEATLSSAGHFKSACLLHASIEAGKTDSCPAGEINYYLLRSLGLNGGNDVHHAQAAFLPRLQLPLQLRLRVRVRFRVRVQRLPQTSAA